jgi:hypothetical protein
MINKLNGLHKKQKRKKEEEKAAREAVVATALQKRTENASAPKQYAESAEFYIIRHNSTKKSCQIHLLS